jgi:hypothetical protein
MYPSLKGLFMKKAQLVIRMQLKRSNFARSGSFPLDYYILRSSMC